MLAASLWIGLTAIPGLAPAPALTGLAFAPDSIAVTFLANEGVLVSSGSATVLIDGLFGEGLPSYGVVSPTTRSALQRAMPPHFSAVDFVLATHVHRDHFDPTAVLDHLRSNARGIFVSTTEARGRLRAADPHAARSMAGRIVGVEVAPGQRRRVASAQGVIIDALGLPHGPTSVPVANIGFLIEIGGRRVLHIGDTTVESDGFASLGLARVGIDVALLPYWYLITPELRAVVRRDIRPTSIVVLHAPAPGHESAYMKSQGGWTQVSREIRTQFPNAQVLDRELDAARF